MLQNIKKKLRSMICFVVTTARHQHVDINTSNSNFYDFGHDESLETMNQDLEGHEEDLRRWESADKYKRRILPWIRHGDKDIPAYLRKEECQICNFAENGTPMPCRDECHWMLWWWPYSFYKNTQRDTE
jgi:hypothetical protein